MDKILEQMRLDAETFERQMKWVDVERIIRAQFFTPRWQFWKHRKLRRYLDIAINNLQSENTRR